jgi:hypothetical protein
MYIVFTYIIDLAKVTHIPYDELVIWYMTNMSLCIYIRYIVYVHSLYIFNRTYRKCDFITCILMVIYAYVDFDDFNKH